MTSAATPIRPVAVDGSKSGVAALAAALDAALEGGPAVLPHPPGAPPPVTQAPAGTGVVIATSGSTGDRKLVALPTTALRASATAAAARLGGRAHWLLALPTEHIAGVQVVVRALLAHTAPHVLDLRPGFQPDAFAVATAALPPGRRYTSLVPTQLARLLDSAGALDALRSYAAVLIGGAALEHAVHLRARAAGVPVVTTYGMSETAGGCVYDGVPLAGVRVDLDPDGRILLGGPTLASGYLGRPQETATAFVGGRFRTDDLGRWHTGRLEVLGRADDVIVTGGEKVSPAAVERVLAAQPGVRAACVVGVADAEWGQRVMAAVVPEEAQATAAWVTPLQQAVRDALGRAAVPRRVVPVSEIPLRGIGKPDRAAVARLVTAAGLEPTPLGADRAPRG